MPLALLAGLALAQAQRGVPFIAPGVAAFNPEVSVVNSGALLDAQATVSQDRKYVTITARPQESTLLALQNFTFQTQTNFGTVGGVGTPRAAGSILERQGMTLITPAN
jgi:hypothetical protein